MVTARSRTRRSCRVSSRGWWAPSTCLQRPARPRTGRRVAPYDHDATRGRGVCGHADLVVRPGNAAEVAAVMALCYERDVPLIPRGGGTGLAGGAVPLGGRRGVLAGADARDPRTGAGAVADARRGGRQHPPRAAARARERALLPPGPGRLRAVADRRQRRHQRRRPARLQVRRHRQLGDGPGGRDRRPARRSRSGGRTARTSPGTTSRAC